MRSMAKDAGRRPRPAASLATRCPAAAWDMQKFFYNVTKAGEVKYANLVQIERN